MDKEDEYQEHGFNGLSGLSDLLETNMWQISAALEMQGVLFGDLKNGFSNDVDALERYDETILNRCEDFYRPVLEKFLNIIYKKLNINEPVNFEFISLLIKKHDEEQMDSIKKYQELLSAMLGDGIITTEQYAKSIKTYSQSNKIDFFIENEDLQKLKQNENIDKELDIINILNQAIEYEAEYIILECWEASIALGVFDNIPFDIKVLTNFYDSGNGHANSVQLYQNKLKFFKGEENAICLFNIVGDLLSDGANATARLVKEAACKNIVLYDSIGAYDWIETDGSFLPYEITFKDRHSFKLLGYTADDVKYRAGQRNIGLENQSMNIYCKGETFDISTTLSGSAHLENIISAVAILSEAAIFDTEKFKTFISDQDLQIPERMEDLKYNNETIIIDTEIETPMQLIKRYKAGRKVITVASYKLTRVSSNENYRKEHSELSYEYDFNREPELLNKYADYVYVTLNDICDLNQEEILNNFSKRLTIPYTIIADRTQAIETAIKEHSDTDDIVCITGRGNEKVRFTGYRSIEEFDDRKVVENTILKLKSKKEESK